MNNSSSKEDWYVFHERAQLGPYTLVELEKQIQEGRYSFDTLFWCGGENLHWVPMRDIASLRRVLTSSPPVPAAPSSPKRTQRISVSSPPSSPKRTEKLSVASHVHVPQPPPLAPPPPTPPPAPKAVPAAPAPTSSTPRPWTRYWARIFDIIIGGLVFGVIFACLESSVWEFRRMIREMGSGSEFILPYFVFPIFLMVTEAFWLSTAGATLGKAIFGVSVRKADGTKLDFSQALTRSLAVWYSGFGLNIPLVSLITQLVAYNRLKEKGATSWDQNGGYKVIHREATIGWFLLALLLFILLLAIIGSASH